MRVLRPKGDSTARLCIRDLSMNGTGHKRPDGKPPVHLDKRVDTPLQDGSVILVPMLLKVTQDPNDRAWLKVDIEGTTMESADEPAGKGNGQSEEDIEKARMRFVELLLQTREVSAGTTYEEAKKLLGSSADWHAVDESTRKECFDIFVEHLRTHQSAKKKDKKKGKEKEKGKKHKKGGQEDDAEPKEVVATPEPKASHKEEKKKRRERRGAASGAGSDAGSPERKRKREKKGGRRSRSRGRSASGGGSPAHEKRRRRG
mmetsp:Transcript_77174/g.213954  ORF Transcript_77174/g.213954 Transcript_77174/m.213954 type:complete len:259 (+) Transcript_77174:1-777(+)